MKSCKDICRVKQTRKRKLDQNIKVRNTINLKRCLNAKPKSTNNNCALPTETTILNVDENIMDVVHDICCETD